LVQVICDQFAAQRLGKRSLREIFATWNEKQLLKEAIDYMHETHPDFVLACLNEIAEKFDVDLDEFLREKHPNLRLVYSLYFGTWHATPSLNRE
jgi:hypothetical protein